MEMFGLEDFSLLASDWAQDQSFGFSHYDDLKVGEAQDGLRDFPVKVESTAFGDVDAIDDILDSSVGELADPFGAEWMEKGDLLQYLDMTETDSDLLSEQLPVSPVQLVVAPVQLLAVVSLVEKEPPADNTSVNYSFIEGLLKGQAEVQSPVTPPTSPEPQVAPEWSSFSSETSVDDLPATTDCTVPLDSVEFIGSPLSAEDVESLLSSSAPSPSSSVDGSSSDAEKGSTLESSHLYKLVANVTKGQKSRGSPYSRTQADSKGTKSKGRRQTASVSPSPGELELDVMSKKDRKKLQNKNAAIRYRMKKKEESETIRNEEGELEQVNKALTEKVEQLTREIKYMKDLITEVRKARGLQV